MVSKVNLSDTLLLLTRPEPAATRFAGQVEQRLGTFAGVIVSPLMEIEVLPAEIPDDPAAHHVFTSEMALRALEGRLSGQGRVAWCVGGRTAAAARAAGFEVLGKEPDVDRLARRMETAGLSEKILHLGGLHRAGDLVGHLQGAGLDARAIAIYDQRSLPLSDQARIALQDVGDVATPLFSARSAALLATEAAGRRARLHVAAISPAVLRSWRGLPGERAEVAEMPDASGVIQALGSLFDAYRYA
ncbi:uroporphyrinogen-III synthase [Tropicimonas sp. IMCC34043]|uniref:uroporphyrinogen-III synthase n=1 Tax=Tropicimonas sp. IMCC34043 TaxID=2248760 RepID=UPI000E263014|nr:uroporphyrinogen-III synthase [Tropicimonas sp. IMCC34043]